MSPTFRFERPHEFSARFGHAVKRIRVSENLGALKTGRFSRFRENGLAETRTVLANGVSGAD